MTELNQLFDDLLKERERESKGPLFQGDTVQRRERGPAVKRQDPSQFIPPGRPRITDPTTDGRARTESIRTNFMMDFDDLIEGYKMIGSYLAQEGLSGAGEMASRFPKAMWDSYARWVNAAKRGQFLDLVHDHPLEFLQDVSAPLTVFVGGAGGVASVFGKSAPAAQVARIMNKTAKIMNVGDFFVDPLAGVSVFGVRKLGSAIFRGVRGPKLPPHQMNITDAVSEQISPRDRIDKWRTQFINSNWPLEKLSKEVGSDELALFAQLHAGVPAAVADFIQFGPSKFSKGGFGDKTGTPGLAQTINDLGHTRQREFEDLLVARRTIEWDERGLRTGQNAQDAIAVLGRAANRKLERMPSKAEWKEMLKSDTFDPDLKLALERYDAYNRDLLTYVRDSDQIGQKDFDEIVRQNEFYAPFERASKKPGGLLKRAGSLLKRAKGSEDAVLSPLRSTIAMTHRVINEGSLNRIRRVLGEIADLDIADNPIIRRQPPSKIAANVSLDEAFATVGARQIEKPPVDSAFTRKDIVEANRSAADEAAIDIDFSKPSPVFRPKAAKELPDNWQSYLEGGQRRWFEVADKEIAQTVGSLGIKPNSDLMGWIWPATIPKKMLQSGIVLDPSFGGLNFTRDQFMATLQSNYGYRPVWDFMIGMAHHLGKTEFYSQMRTSGMFMSALVDLDRAKQLKGLTDSLQGGQRGGGRFMTSKHWREVGKNLVTNPLYLLQEFSSGAEMGTRLGAAKRALDAEIKKGTPKDRAFALAGREGRSVTTDFARVGANPLWQLWHSITAFQNAGIQGLARAGSAFVENPTRFTAKAVAAITIPSALLYLHNMEDPEYAEIPDTEKDLFWHVRSPTTGRLYRIPKPFEAGLLFGTLPTRVMESFMEDDPSSIPKIRDRILEQFNPVGWPTAVRPIVEIIANKNFFFDQPIESPGQQRFLVGQRANAGTSELSRILSEWTKVFSSSKVAGRPADATLSPLQIDHLIYGYSGTLGRRFLEGTDRAMHAAGVGTGVAPPEPRGGLLGKLPIIDRFMGNRNKSSQFRSDFFDINEVIQQKANTFSNMKKLRQTAAAKEFRDENEFDIRQAKKWDKVMRRIMKIIGRQKQIRAGDESSSDKRALIDTLDLQINVLARRVVEERRALLKTQEQSF